MRSVQVLWWLMSYCMVLYAVSNHSNPFPMYKITYLCLTLSTTLNTFNTCTFYLIKYQHLIIHGWFLGQTVNKINKWPKGNGIRTRLLLSNHHSTSVSFITSEHHIINTTLLISFLHHLCITFVPYPHSFGVFFFFFKATTRETAHLCALTASCFLQIALLAHPHNQKCSRF